jgi:7,8-dihydropterin-6-yl-methyl-4-(beta-D-ribofuranosyl)aminobenzene 5'-phosphate synthase
MCMLSVMKINLLSGSVVAIVLLLNPTLCPAQSTNRVTILSDAFGKPSSLKLDWGYSALVEYNGERILFDTGNDADIFAHNVKALGVSTQTVLC